MAKKENEDSIGTQLPILIDRNARDNASKPFFWIPKSDNDLSKGFQEISSKRIANMINKASWWLETHLGPSRGSFEPFAYVGPKDLRYIVLAVAAIKVGRKALFASPYATMEAQKHVLDLTKCWTYLCAASSRSVPEKLEIQRPQQRHFIVPELKDWLDAEDVPLYEYQKSWDEAKDDEVMVFHTSGTTGLPKPVTFTNHAFAAAAYWGFLSRSNGPLGCDYGTNLRLYSPLPTLHMAGMFFALMGPVLWDMPVILGPADKPATVDIANDVLRFSNANAALMAPSLLVEFARDGTKLETLKKLETVIYTGSALETSVGNLISQHVILQGFIGATDLPCWEFVRHDPEDWAYYKFHPDSGVVFEHRSGNLYELIVTRVPGRQGCQGAFLLHPDVHRYPTRDLFSKHPVKPDLWMHCGRTDDLITFSHGEDLYATEMEMVIQQHPRIRLAIIGGMAKPKPCLILELVEEVSSPACVNRDQILDEIWPAIEKANQLCSEHVRLTRALIVLAEKEKPFVILPKGTIDRRNTLKLYAEEINALYS